MKLPVRLFCLAAVAGLALASCAEPARVLAPESRPPAADTPQGAVKAFEWAVDHRSIEVLEQLFTEDFVFTGSGLDSAGDPSREVLGRRDDLLQWFQCLFAGGGLAGPPRVERIRFEFDKNLVPARDTRPGYRDQDSLFKTVRTAVSFSLGFDDGSTVETTGYALFYLTRGDTAAIPAELAARGFAKDENRWWITRWEDETLSAEGSPGATDPSRNVTIGALLKAFDCTPASRPAR